MPGTEAEFNDSAALKNCSWYSVLASVVPVAVMAALVVDDLDAPYFVALVVVALGELSVVASGIILAVITAAVILVAVADAL